MPLLFIQLFTFIFASSLDSLSLDIETSAPNTGVVRVALFDNEQALKQENPAVGYTISFEKSTKSLNYTLPEIPKGAFAIGAYHDVNNNGVLDKNAFGIPTEPYDFSGQPRSRWRSPRWEEVVISNPSEQQTLKLVLRYWKEQ